MANARRIGIRSAPTPAVVAGAVLSAALTVGISVGLSGCAAPGPSDGQRVADWVAEQEHVTGADSYVSEDPWNQFLDLTILVDPAISDDDLVTLSEAVENRAEDAGWEHPFLTYTLGDGRSFSNLGGAPTLGVFLGIRNDDDYVIASARGDGDCGGIFCVTLDADSPEALLVEVNAMLDLARESGGVQTNLDFTATSTDGRFRVSAEPLAPIDDAVEFWRRIAPRVSIDHGSAWSIEPVGDIPPHQFLDLTVPDEVTKAQVETYAATQTRVEVRVEVAS
ncbi:hypothetical protein N1027_04240 [Herbiconiux sp. CPCC 205763]|uniref:Lipoprotein n=1 Tax=Herbiconiux aconitum TaxID=2970913 RepID=A0ABT2GM88_9MICO|nr:hypothetical protein [Herbiconiux aconitum]MCS5717343.1 hypothetical protein [Herbiconiux aconitum]